MVDDAGSGHANNNTNPGGMLGCTRAGACGSGRVQGKASQVKSSRVDVRCSMRCSRQPSIVAGRLCLGVGAELMRRPGRYKGTKLDAMRYRVWHEKAKMCIPGDKGHE
jgi:hypothetical protein